MPSHERVRGKQTLVIERDKPAALYVNQVCHLLTQRKLNLRPNTRLVTVIVDLRRHIKPRIVHLYRRVPSTAVPALPKQIDEYSTSGLQFLMASTPSNNSTPPCIVTRSRFNKGGVQLLPPLPDDFFSTKRQSQTPPTEKGSRARKRPLSRRHTTTGIEMKMESAASEVSVTQKPKTETEEISGEPTMKKEPTASTFTAALCEELLRYPLVKLEKCSPEKSTRTQEPPVEEKIDIVPDHEPITHKLDSQPPAQVDVASDHNKEEPITPKLEANSTESSSSNTPKLESMSTEPSTPNIPKLESKSTEPNTPNTPKLESKSTEPNTPNTPKLESKSTEPNTPNTPPKLESMSTEPNTLNTPPKLESMSTEPNTPNTPPKLESMSTEPNTPNTPKLESMSTEPNTPNTPPKLESMSTEPNTPNTPKLESMSTEPNSPNTSKFESTESNSPNTSKLESTESNSPNTLNLETMSTKPNSPLVPKLECSEPNNPVTPKFEFTSTAEPNSPVTPKLECAKPNNPITPKLQSMTPEPKTPEIDKSPRIANTPPAFSLAVQTTRTHVLPNHSTITIVRRRDGGGRSLLVPTPSSPVWPRNIVRSYSLPLVPVTTMAATSSIFSLVQPGQRVTSTLTSDLCISRTPSPVAKFPTSQTLILSPEIESSATPHFSRNSKDQPGKSILKEQLTAPRYNVPKTVASPKREPVNAMRKIFKSNQTPRTPKAKGKLGLKIAQALDISLGKGGVKACSPKHAYKRRSVGDSNIFSYNELWSSNEFQGTLTKSPQPSASRTLTWQSMGLVSQGTSTSATVTSQNLGPYNTFQSNSTTRLNLTSQPTTMPTFNTLTLLPTSYKVVPSQTTPDATKTVPSKTLFVYEVLVPPVATTCDVKTTQDTSTSEGLVLQATAECETQKSQTISTRDTVTSQDTDTDMLSPQSTAAYETQMSHAISTVTPESETSVATLDTEMLSPQSTAAYETQMSQAISTATTDFETVVSQTTLHTEMLSPQSTAAYETQMSQVISTVTPDSETVVSQTTPYTEMLSPQSTAAYETVQPTPESQATSDHEMTESQGCETLSAQIISSCETMASQSMLDIDENVSQATSNCEMLESQVASSWSSEAHEATCEELTAIFEEDWNYQVTLDSVLHSNAPGLWHADEMDTLLSQYNLDKCIFNDETPALFELVGYNEDIEDFTPPSTCMQQENLPENIFDDSD